MIEQIFDNLNENSKLTIRAALGHPNLREFFRIAAVEYDKAMTLIDPRQSAETIADEYRQAHAYSRAYHDLEQFVQKLITIQSQSN